MLEYTNIDPWYLGAFTSWRPCCTFFTFEPLETSSSSLIQHLFQYLVFFQLTSCKDAVTHSLSELPWFPFKSSFSSFSLLIDRLLLWRTENILFLSRTIWDKDDWHSHFSPLVPGDLKLLFSHVIPVGKAAYYQLYLTPYEEEMCFSADYWTKNSLLVPRVQFHQYLHSYQWIPDRNTGIAHQVSVSMFVSYYIRVISRNIVHNKQHIPAPSIFTTVLYQTVFLSFLIS